MYIAVYIRTRVHAGGEPMTAPRPLAKRPVRAASNDERHAKNTRFDADVWQGVKIYQQSASVGDETKAINDLLRIALRAVATSGKPDVHSAPTVALPSGGDMDTRLLLETMERMLCTSIGLIAQLGDAGRPPRVTEGNKKYAVDVRDECRTRAELAMGLTPSRKRRGAA